MMEEIFKQFKNNAESVSAVVIEIKNQQDISNYVHELAALKKMKNIALAGFDDQEMDSFKEGLNGLFFLENNVKEMEGKIDIGVNPAQFGIAETGSVVLHSDDEDVRISSMLSEINVLILSKKNIVHKKSDLSETLKKWFAQASNYTAFITGPSRTADIERVLALGAHGPVELHILITN